MKLIELDAAQENLALAAQTAAKDLDPLREKLQHAETLLGRQSVEVDRLRKVSGRIHAKLATLSERARTAKRLAMQTVVDEVAGDGTGYRTYRTLRQEHEFLTQSLAYLTHWAATDADLAFRRAEIAEMECRADLLEGQAVAQRLAMANAFQNAAAEYDPGATIQTSGAWSDAQMERVHQLRKNIADLKQQLSETEQSVANERELAATVWA